MPLRCTLFVDTSNAVRLGPPGRNALARLVEIGSAVAQANMTARDLTGLCLFDEEGVKVTKPRGRGAIWCNSSISLPMPPVWRRLRQR